MANEKKLRQGPSLGFGLSIVLAITAFGGCGTQQSQPDQEAATSPRSTTVYRQTTAPRATVFSQEPYIYPYLQNVTPDAITVMWETDGTMAGTVEYGLDGHYDRSVTESEPAKIHEIRITGLEPFTRDPPSSFVSRPSMYVAMCARRCNGVRGVIPGELRFLDPVQSQGPGFTTRCTGPAGPSEPRPIRAAPRAAPGAPPGSRRHGPAGCPIGRPPGTAGGGHRRRSRPAAVRAHRHHRWSA